MSQQQQVPAKKQQELQAQYTNYKDTLQAIASKIGDVEQESEEHKLVLETLEPLPGDRKCFRMINGVLVERTVQDVLPQLKTNAEGLKKVLDDLLKQYTKEEQDSGCSAMMRIPPEAAKAARDRTTASPKQARWLMRLTVAVIP
ncbi:hypothetical protein MBLNU457_g0059t1 [Dothideomycetes sp. NU457]